MKTIKEIIDAERWTKNIWNEYAQTAESHNEMLDRIEKAVMELIAELEAQLPTSAKTEDDIAALRKPVDEFERALEIWWGKYRECSRALGWAFSNEGQVRILAAHNADLDAAAERFWKEIASSYRKGYLKGSASNDVLRQRIAELEDKLDDEKQINDGYRRYKEAAIKLMMNAEADLVGMAHRIAELEAKVPKITNVVNKELADDSDKDCAIFFGECGNCGEGIMPNWEACPICKSELNWGDE